LGSQLDGVSSRMMRDNMQPKGSLNARESILIYTEKT